MGLRYFKEIESKNLQKQVDFLDALDCGSVAWVEITADVIKNRFRKVKFVDSDDCVGHGRKQRRFSTFEGVFWICRN